LTSFSYNLSKTPNANCISISRNCRIASTGSSDTRTKPASSNFVNSRRIGNGKSMEEKGILKF